MELIFRTVKSNITVEIENEESEYEVEAILDFKLVRNIMEYLVKWKGYLYDENIWEFKVHLENA